MDSQTLQLQDSPSPDEIEVRERFRHILDGWNKRSTAAFATPIAGDGDLIGFDRSQLIGRAEIVSTLQHIFADYPTAPYVSKVRFVRLLSPEVAVLHAIVGMIPPAQPDLDPKLNAIQTLIAAKRGRHWRIVLFQNTPAQFHDRPDLVQEMTEELRQLLK